MAVNPTLPVLNFDGTKITSITYNGFPILRVLYRNGSQDTEVFCVCTSGQSACSSCSTQSSNSCSTCSNSSSSVTCSPCLKGFGNAEVKN